MTGLTALIDSLNSTNMSIKIILIRHGQTAGGREHRYIGALSDEPLEPDSIDDIRKKLKSGCYSSAKECSSSDNCSDQSRTRQDFFSDFYTDLCVYSSPMKRCLQTASIIFPDQQIHQIEDLREISFGLWEGKTYSEILSDAALKDSYQRWIDTGAESAVPEGETKAEFIARSMRAFRACLDYSCHFNTRQDNTCQAHSYQDSECQDHLYHDIRHIAIVCHNGTIMSVISQLTGMDYYDCGVSYGEGWLLEIDESYTTADTHMPSVKLCMRLHN